MTVVQEERHGSQQTIREGGRTQRSQKSTTSARHIHAKPPRTSRLSAPVSEESSTGEDLVFTLSLPPWQVRLPPTFDPENDPPVTPCRLKPSVKIIANTPSINTSRLPVNRALRHSSSSRCVEKLKITMWSVKQTPIVILNAHIRCFKCQNNQYIGFSLQPKWDWTAVWISCSYPHVTWMLTFLRSASWRHFPAD